MLKRRLILDSYETESYYHVMTRCVHGENHLDETCREILRKMIWKVAEFCHVQVITYAILPNHFHVLIHIPQRTEISDYELLRRYRVLHPEYAPYMPARIEVIGDWLKRNSQEGKAFRQQQLALMFDLSAFMKLLKQRFTIWFNQKHNRFGTLWAERFKSVLVDCQSDALRTMAAYIDLNAVRKGLVADPKDYRFCGYAEALAGSARARSGLRLVTHESVWAQSQRAYRLLLYSTGASPRAKGHAIDPTAFNEVMDAEGRISLPELLRHRWRYFTMGNILGSPAFVAQHRPLLAQPVPSPLAVATRSSHPTSKKSPFTQAPASTPWGDFSTARRITTLRT